jgi:hypothetical protein
MCRYKITNTSKDRKRIRLETSRKLANLKSSKLKNSDQFGS